MSIHVTMTSCETEMVADELAGSTQFWTAPATVSFTCCADLAVIVTHCLLSKLDVFSLIALSASAVIVSCWYMDSYDIYSYCYGIIDDGLATDAIMLSFLYS